MYSVPRTILPHGASYNGHPVTLHITYESTKDTFTLEVLLTKSLHTHWCQVTCMGRVLLYVFILQTHSNETIGNIRWKISEHLSCPVDNVQIFANDSVVSVNKQTIGLFILMVFCCVSHKTSETYVKLEFKRHLAPSSN